MSPSRAVATGPRRTYTPRVRLGLRRTLERLARRGFRALLRSPFAVRVAAGALALLLAWALANWIYQVVRKPAEMLFPVSGALFKSPAETWRQYAPLFRRHSTA